MISSGSDLIDVSGRRSSEGISGFLLALAFTGFQFVCSRRSDELHAGSVFVFFSCGEGKGQAGILCIRSQIHTSFIWLPIKWRLPKKKLNPLFPPDTVSES